MGKRIKIISLILCLTLVFPVMAQAEETDGDGRQTEKTIIIENTKEDVIMVDTKKKYQGMNAAFSKGYEPSIRKNTMNLVIPFLADRELKEDKISVGVVFERDENSPFYYKNYQKEVRQSENGVYLYQCQIKLKKDRVNGQYPLHLSVKAQTSGRQARDARTSGEQAQDLRATEKTVQQDFTIYVEITDGKAAIKNGEEEDENPSKEPAGGNTGDEFLGTGGLEDTTQPSGTSPGEEITHQPRVLISQNSLQQVSIEAGDSVFWTIKAKNCSGSQSLENMKVMLTCESKDITFEKNEWYFDKTGAGNTVDLSQNITIGKKALEEPIAAQFTFEYEDKKGNAYTSTDTIRISVSQPQQASLVNMSFPESISASETCSLKFQIQNTGLAVIYNARVKMEGKGLYPVGEFFLGNMEASSSMDGEISVFVGTLDMNEQGEMTGGDEDRYGETFGTVVFSYEDAYGNITEQTLDLHTTIKKPKNAKNDNENDKKEEEKTNQWWLAIVVEVVLVLMIINVWLLIRMRRYKKM